MFLLLTIALLSTLSRADEKKEEFKRIVKRRRELGYWRRQLRFAEDKHIRRNLEVFTPSSSPTTSAPTQTTDAPTKPTCENCDCGNTTNVATEYQRIEAKVCESHWQSGSARFHGNMFYVLLDNGETMTQDSFSEEFRLLHTEKQTSYLNYAPAEILDNGIWKKGFVLNKQMNGEYTVLVKEGEKVLSDVPVSQLRPLMGYTQNAPVTVCAWESGTVETVHSTTGQYGVKLESGSHYFVATNMRQRLTYDYLDVVQVQNVQTGVNRVCTIIGIDEARNEYTVAVQGAKTTETGIPITRISAISPTDGGRRQMETKVSEMKCHEPTGKLENANFLNCEKLLIVVEKFAGTKDLAEQCEFNLDQLNAIIPKDTIMKDVCPCTCGTAKVKEQERRRLPPSAPVYLGDAITYTPTGSSGKIVFVQSTKYTLELEDGTIVTNVERNSFTRDDSFALNSEVEVSFCDGRNAVIDEIQPDGRYVVRFEDNSKEHFQFSQIKSATPFLGLWDSVSVVEDNEVLEGFEIINVHAPSNKYDVFRESDSMLKLSVAKNKLRLHSTFKL